MRYLLAGLLLIACGDDAVDSGAVDSGTVDAGVDSGGDSSLGEPCPLDPPADGIACTGARSCGWDGVSSHIIS
jgi:hypothetical protein